MGLYDCPIFLSFFFVVIDIYMAPVVNRIQVRTTRHSNNLQLVTLYCHSNQFMNSFFPKTISQWNLLPEELLLCVSLASLTENWGEVNNIVMNYNIVIVEIAKFGTFTSGF